MDDEEIIDFVKKKKGVTSDYAVAKIIGISQMSISKVRTKRGRLTGDTLMKIGEVLDMNPNDLVKLGQQELDL